MHRDALAAAFGADAVAPRRVPRSRRGSSGWRTRCRRAGAWPTEAGWEPDYVRSRARSDRGAGEVR
jgi:hypothetical protein